MLLVDGHEACLHGEWSDRALGQLGVYDMAMETGCILVQHSDRGLVVVIGSLAQRVKQLFAPWKLQERRLWWLFAGMTTRFHAQFCRSKALHYRNRSIQRSLWILTAFDQLQELLVVLALGLWVDRIARLLRDA